MVVCRKLLLAVILFAIPVLATHVAVLETVADPSVKERVSFLDRQYLTNVLREEAIKQLPAAQGFTIMTRENINAMLPPGKAIEDCEGSCLAETGRNIAADYICQARVSSFGTKLTLSAELYETAGNKLVASFNGRGTDVEDLLEVIKDYSPDFFQTVKIGTAEVFNGEINKKKPEELTGETPVEDFPVANVKQNYGKHNSIESVRMNKNIPVNVDAKKSRSAAGKAMLGASSVVTFAGVLLAVITDDAMRDVGIGLVIAGGIAFAISLSF